MFKKEYQGGSHVEVFSAQGRDPLAPWKLTGSVSRDYFKDVRGYVVTMEGGSSTTNTKMQLPKTDKTSLGLVQRYLVLQFLIPEGARLALDLCVVDGGGSRRRIQMSTSQREIAATHLNARIPLTGIVPGQWVNLCIDLGSLVSGLFKAQSYKSLEGVTIGGSCMLRRVFTLRSCPPDTTETESLADQPALEEIPRACQMPSSVTNVQTQVITYATVSSPSHAKQSSAVSTLGSSSSENIVTSDERPTHIAFGQKVAIPDHILGSKQSGRSALSSRQSSAGKEATPVNSQSIQPKPPSKPADPTLLRIQKKRVRMISREKKEPQTASQVSNTAPSSTTNDSGFQADISDGFSVKSIEERVATPSVDNMEHSDSKIDQTTIDMLRQDHLAQDEHLVLDVLKYKDTVEFDDKGNEQNKNNVLNTSVVSDDYLNSTGDSQMLNISVASSVGQSELDSSVDEVLYLYRSLPRSAERRLTDVKESLEGGRSADLEDDFVSPIKEALPKSSFPLAPPVAEVRPRSSRQKGGAIVSRSSHIAPGNDVKLNQDQDQMNETRLSDDYDWRQYASMDDGELTQSEQSLRTRLANAGHMTPQPVGIGAIGPDTEMEGTLSGSVTHSGWTEKFKDAAINPLHDSLDIREMGGMLSPLSGTLTEEPDFVRDPDQSKADGEELELMYDPQLNCFYDPVTGKYYELAQ